MKPRFNFDMFFGRILMYGGTGDIVRKDGALVWTCHFPAIDGTAEFIYLAQGDDLYYEANVHNKLKQMNKYTVWKFDENLKPVSPCARL